MSDISASRDLLTDAYGRIRDSVTELTDGLSDEAAGWRPAAGANTIAWLLWHLARVQDDHVSGLAGTEQVWPRWRDRFDLPFAPEATGYGQSEDEVGAVRVPAELLAGYHAEVHTATQHYLDKLTEPELTRIVDTDWDPPVTVAVRLVSVVDDAARHLGQAEYLRGLLERRDAAWHTAGAADR